MGAQHRPCWCSTFSEASADAGTHGACACRAGGACHPRARGLLRGCLALGPGCRRRGIRLYRGGSVSALATAHAPLDECLDAGASRLRDSDGRRWRTNPFYIPSETPTVMAHEFAGLRTGRSACAPVLGGARHTSLCRHLAAPVRVKRHAAVAVVNSGANKPQHPWRAFTPVARRGATTAGNYASALSSAGSSAATKPPVWRCQRRA